MQALATACRPSYPSRLPCPSTCTQVTNMLRALSRGPGALVRRQEEADGGTRYRYQALLPAAAADMVPI